MVDSGIHMPLSVPLQPPKCHKTFKHLGKTLAFPRNSPLERSKTEGRSLMQWFKTVGAGGGAKSDVSIWGGARDNDIRLEGGARPSSRQRLWLTQHNGSVFSNLLFYPFVSVYVELLFCWFLFEF